MPRETDTYFERFGYCERQIVDPPAPDLGLVVVIPCFNEPDLLASLDSLRRCEHPACAVEVLVVVNAATNSEKDVHLQNALMLREAAAWASEHTDDKFALRRLHFPELPPRHAGVGLARKIGMDEAARRLGDVGNSAGIIACFDADCRCAPNYLTGLERHFREHPGSPGCSIYFEHSLEDCAPELSAGIAAYELHLRYYVQALRFVGAPFAHHTIGSCMAVRAEAYKKQGGMNKRQAGEDFYFLQKIIALGGFTELVETTVFPSARVSERVPFGTGKAMRDHLDGQPQLTYPLKAFLDLKCFFDEAPALLCWPNSWAEPMPESWPATVKSFLERNEFAKAMNEILENSASESARRKRFFHWFNAFQAMKFIHHARDHYYGAKDVTEQAAKLLPLMSGQNGSGLSTRELLQIYRRFERRSRSSISPSARHSVY
jgi:glycosyltransferase involved in cell wall biosynthesis